MQAIKEKDGMRGLFFGRGRSEGGFLGWIGMRMGFLFLLACFLENPGSRAEIEGRFSGKGYAYSKQEPADVLIGALPPHPVRYRELRAAPAYIENPLRKNAANGTAGRKHPGRGRG